MPQAVGPKYSNRDGTGDDSRLRKNSKGRSIVVIVFGLFGIS